MYLKSSRLQSRLYVAVTATLLLIGCGSNDSSNIPHNLDTPEGAILSLEDAYRAEDIEAAVKCKDFTVEATLMLQRLEKDLSGDPEILAKTAEVLELGFRNEMKGGFPDFHNVVSAFPEKKPFQGRDDIVEVTEVIRHSGGSTATNKLVVAKTPKGWKVIAYPD